MSKLTIFILSRDRLPLLEEALDSLLALELKDTNIIVSENSVKLSLVDIEKKDSTIQFIKRNNLSFDDHMDQILREVNSEYFMMFHDDDVFLSVFAQEIVKILDYMNKYPSISAIGCNAFLINQAGENLRIFNPDLKAVKVINTKKDLVEGYINPTKAIVPFPSYIYRSKNLKNIQFKNTFVEKHSDVTFLLSILETGPIVWWPIPLMNYRLHLGNMTKVISVELTRQLCDIFKKIDDIDKSAVEDFYYTSYLKSASRYKSSSKLLKIFVFYAVRPQYFCRRIFSKMARMF